MDIDAFFSRVRDADQRVLMLDYDGTLAPFTVHRDEAVPYPGVRDVLEAILALPDTRTVIVTGRAIRDLVRLLDVTPLPEIWGSHGWERLSPQCGHALTPLDEQSRRKLREATEFLDGLSQPNLREAKEFGVAAHWRGRREEEIESLRARILNEWSRIAQNSRLEIHPFEGGLELRVGGHDKGSAVGAILNATSGTVSAAFLGDDLTDEDAFQAMPEGGLRVLVRPELRPTAADLWITPPAELLAFLTRWKEVSRR